MFESLADQPKMSLQLVFARARTVIRVRREALPASEADLRDGPVAILEDAAKELTKVENDKNLSALGRVDGFARVARLALAKLEEWATKRLGGYDAHIASIEQTIMKSAPKVRTDAGDRVVKEMRAQEIRRQWAALDELERDALFLGEQDPEIIEALATSPKILLRRQPGDWPVTVALVNPDRAHERAIARAEAREPELAAELQDLLYLRRVYVSAIEEARQAIVAAVPGVLPDAAIVSV